MKNVKLGLLLLILGGCASHSPVEPVKQHDNMNSVLWVQTSAEYEGNAIQVFETASRLLSELKQKQGLTADLDQAASYGCVAGQWCDPMAMKNLIPAVVLDVDETVLDNSPYQARLVANNADFAPDTWDAWISERSAGAVPGAVPFIRAAQAAGIAVIFITNRSCSPRSDAGAVCPQREDTLVNLVAAGFPPLGEQDLLILRGERPEWDMSEKQSRRAFVAGDYRIMMLIGDDLGDLASGIKSASVEARSEFVRAHAAFYGRHWFQLSNPTYGSWSRALGDGNRWGLLNSQ